MPFYEYRCQACGAQVEVLQKITDAPLKKCTECGKNQLQKLVSAPVFRLKGSGWYETDFKTDQDRKRNLAGEDEAKEAKSDSGSESSDSSKGESESKSTSHARPARRSAKPATPSKAARRPTARAKPKSKAKAKARGRK
jgi:putative FmdB family regulatory protein